MQPIKTSMSTQVVVNMASYDNKAMSGYLYHPFLETTISFSDTLEMINLMDGLFDDLQFPQASCTFRKFKDRVLVQRTVDKGKQEMIDQNEKGAVPVKATFVVHVKYRQSATWQGTITWTEKNISKNFRSTFEMLKLMDNVIETENSQNWNESSDSTEDGETAPESVE